MLAYLVAFTSSECHSFTVLKESMSIVSWLNRKTQHQDCENPIPKQ